VDFNDRELAMFAWTGIFLFWMLSKRDVRRAVGGVFLAFAKPVIAGPILFFGLYVAGCVFLAERVGVWRPDLINETIYWFLISGLALFMGVTRVSEQEDFFQRTARRALKWGILAEVIVNLVVMPFWLEFLLLPIITLVVLMQAIAQYQEEHAPVKKLMDGIAGVIGIALFGFVGVSLLADPSRFDAAYGLQILALPVWLTIISLPLIFVIGLWVAYDKVFRRISSMAGNGRVARRAKLTLLRRLHLRARRVGAFDWQWQRRLLDAASADHASGVLTEFLEEQKQLAS
jgi:hypothetical protein